jgi:hypothetical protein
MTHEEANTIYFSNLHFEVFLIGGGGYVREEQEEFLLLGDSSVD